MKNEIYVATRDDLERLIDKAVRVAINQNNALMSRNNATEIMNVKQVSEFLGLSPATIYDKTSRNLIPFKKKGNKLYFIRKEIESWVLEGTCKTIEEIENQSLDYVIKKQGKYHKS